MADYFQVKNQNIFNPPANTSLGNATNQFNDVYVQNDLVLGNVTVTGDTIIAPRVTTITYPGDDTAADTAGGQTITLTGTGFVAGASVLINGSAVGVVSVVSSTTITFTSPANATGSYVIYVINPDGSTAIAIPGIQYSGTPTWTTAAGTLGNVYETASFTQTVTATGDAPITYSVYSGSLPPGSTFNANGTITGTSQLSASPTTYSFTVRATDAQLQDTNRAFSISVIPDVVTWSSPTNNQTYSPAANVVMANITLSATSAVGSGITYSANTLPTGLSLTGANISGTPTVVANTSSLLTATANTTSELSSITINWVVSVASDPYFMYNSLLLPGTGSNGAQNNTFLDGSTNNFTITRNGNTTQGTFSPYGPNWSTQFVRTDPAAFVQAPTNAALSLTGDFTLECWINLSSIPTTNTFPNAYWIIGTGPARGDVGMDWFIGSTTMNFNLVQYSSSVISIAHNMVTGRWYHVAISRTGSAVSAYINGSQVATATNSSSSTAGYNWAIGRAEPTGGESSGGFDGYISNFRVIKGTGIYPSAFTPPTTPLTAISGTSLLTCQSNRFIDNSTNAFTLTPYNSPTIQRFSPFSPTAAYSAGTIGGSGYFDGGTNRLTTATSSLFNLSGANITLECWVFMTATPAVFNRLISIGPNGVLSSLYLGIDTNRMVNFSVPFGSGANVTSGANLIPLNTWTHLAFVLSGSTGTLYINGTQVGQTTGWNITSTTSNYFYLGYDATGTVDGKFTGYVSDARLLIGTALYTTNFTPPTSSVTAITNTRLLLNFTNAGIIDNTMINNLETVGNAKISTAQSKFGGSSMAFDGTGDWLTIPSNPVIAFGTGDFTVECWIYMNSIPSGTSYPGIFEIGNNFFINFRASGTIGLTDSTTVYAQSASSLVTGTWYHVAVVRASGSSKIYINGVGGTAVAFTMNVTQTTATIGGGANGPLGTPFSINGYIDDLRITKGLARYTANFTPATSAFPTY